MNMIIIFLLGMLAFPALIKAQLAIRHRMNTGKAVLVNRKVAGYVVVVRYNGVKRYASVVDLEMGSRAHYSKDDAKQEVIDRFTGQATTARPARDLAFR